MIINDFLYYFKTKNELNDSPEKYTMLIVHSLTKEITGINFHITVSLLHVDEF